MNQLHTFAYMQKPEYVSWHILQLRCCRNGGNRTVCWHKQQLALANHTWVTSCTRLILHNPCQLPSRFCKPQQLTTDLSSRESSSSLPLWYAQHPVQHPSHRHHHHSRNRHHGQNTAQKKFASAGDCPAFACHHAFHLTLPVMSESHSASISTPHHMLRVKHPHNFFTHFAPSKHQLKHLSASDVGFVWLLLLVSTALLCNFIAIWLLGDAVACIAIQIARRFCSHFKVCKHTEHALCRSG